MTVILISKTTEKHRTHTPQHMQSPQGVPTCCALYWQSPAWMQAIPGSHHRRCSARPRWRLWCCRATSGSSKPVPDNCCFCSRVSSPLLQVFMLFMLLFFKLNPYVKGLFLSYGQVCSKPFWEAQPRTLLALLLLPWQVVLCRPCAMGTLSQHSSHFCQQGQWQTNLN